VIEAPVILPELGTEAQDPAAPLGSIKARDKKAAGSARTGRSLVRWAAGIYLGLGVATVLFIAFLLAISSLRETGAQDRLLSEFKASLSLQTGLGAQPANGEAVGLIQAPSIGLQKVMVQGIGADQTMEGPGHDPSTPLPGQAGNVVIIGRRTTYGAPFHALDGLSPGEQLVAFTRQGRFTYTVVESVLEPLGDTSVTAPTTDSRMTLITANPPYRWSSELVVVAKLDGPPLEDSPDATTAPTGYMPGATPGAPNALAAVFIWGEVALITMVGAVILYRRWLPVATYVITTPLILAALYATFENLVRLLPPSI
jgi:sortase A